MNALSELPVLHAVDVAVIGLGPGGLAACIKAAQCGLYVTALTNRSAYIRGQRIKPTQATLDFFYSLKEDNNDDKLFFLKFEQDESIQIKDIEHYLYRKLACYSDQITVIQIPFENSITAILMDTSQNKPYIQLRDETRYYFHHLIGADGHKRTVSDLVKNGLQIPIEYLNCPNQSRHPYHASVQLHINPKKPPSPLPAAHPSELGWSFSYSPRSIVFSDKRATTESPSKYSFSGEIPEFIFNATRTFQSELLMQWAIYAISNHESDWSLASQLDYRISSKKEPSKDELKAVTFELKKSRSNQAYYDLPHGGHYVPIGDARRSPDYQLSHGLNDAILSGIKVVQAMALGSLSHYQAIIASIDASLDSDQVFEEEIVVEEYDPSLMF